MKYLYLAACLFCCTSQANAQFVNNDVRTEQLGLRTGAAYWWSNFKSISSGLGVEEELYYRREHKHWSLELSLNYSTYQRPLHYYATVMDVGTFAFIAYDKETLHTYATMLSIQYLIFDGDRLKSYIGAFTNPVFYDYKIHALPGSAENEPSGGDIKMGGGISCIAEYQLTRHLELNSSLRFGYLKLRYNAISELYTAPEFETSLLIGCGYVF